MTRPVSARQPKVVSCDGAAAAEIVAALIADADPPFQTALVVGHDIEAFARNLGKHRPQLALTTHEVRPEELIRNSKLPFSDRQFDLVVDLDLLALLPGDQRPLLFREFLRIAGRESLVAEPLGTDLQLLIDRSLIKLFRELYNSVHTELASHVDYGLPNPQAVFSWLRHGEDADIFYAGDVLAYRQWAEQSVRRASQGWLRSLAARMSDRTFDLTDPSLQIPETVPRRRHRRLFFLVRRI